MLRKQKVDKYFLKSSPARKITFGQHVIDSVTANSAQFPNLPYGLPAIKAAQNLLVSTSAAAKSGDRSAIAARNSAKKAWDDVWSKTADYVSFLAAGNGMLISQAGFTPTSGHSTPRSKPDPALPDTLTQQEGGLVKVAVKHPGMGKVAAYLYLALPADAQESTAADGTITLTLANGQKIYAKCVTHNATTLGGLEEGKTLKMLVQPVNNKGAGGTTLLKTFTPHQ